MELEPHEKFHDTDGEILEIETRGRRHVDEIFFRVRDVMKRFDMPRLDIVLREKQATMKLNCTISVLIVLPHKRIFWVVKITLKNQ